jgi:Mg-chelatase subunit ChlD
MAFVNETVRRDDEWVVVDSENHETGKRSTDSLTTKVAFGHAAIGASATNLQAVLSVLSPPIQEGKRSPLYLVAVIDISGSMQGEKLRLVVRTMLFVLQHLTESDALGLVAFNSVATVLAPLTHCDEDGRLLLETALRGLKAGSQTNLSGGILQGIELHRDGEKKVEVESCSSFNFGGTIIICLHGW